MLSCCHDLDSLDLAKEVEDWTLLHHPQDLADTIRARAGLHTARAESLIQQGKVRP